MEYRKYEIWHDESKEKGYHHGILFVPIDKKSEIIQNLKRIRDMYSVSYDKTVKFAGSFKKTQRGQLVTGNLAFFSHVIKTNQFNTVTRIYNLSEGNRHNNYKNFIDITGPFGCRFGFLKIQDNLKSLYTGTYADKVEMTFNYALKGCCHGMFNGSNPVEITKFYFDGDKHYHRSINLKAISRGKLRNYIKISDDISIDARQRSERKDDTGLIIDFVDNIVGAFRAKLNGEKDKNNVLYPLSEIWERLITNEIFSNYHSRWYKSISLSELSVNDKTGGIEFVNIFRNPNQEKLFSL